MLPVICQINVCRSHISTVVLLFKVLSHTKNFTNNVNVLDLMVIFTVGIQ